MDEKTLTNKYDEQKLRHQTMDFVPNRRAWADKTSEISRNEVILGRDAFYKKRIDLVQEKSVEESINLVQEELIEENKRESKKRQSRIRRLRLGIISWLILATCLIVSSVFIIKLSLSGVLPMKYFWTIVAGLGIFNLIAFILLLTKRINKVFLIVWSILSIVMIGGLIFATIKISEMSKFINSNFTTNNKQYIIYNIVVNRDSQYKNISELKGKELTVYDDLVQELTKDKIDSKIAEKIDKVKISHSDKIEEVMKSVIDNTRKIIAINTGAYEAYLDVNGKYKNSTRILGTIEIQVEKKKIEVSEGDLAKNPFLVYFSGIDTRSNSMPSRSLSDVNILMAINPKTKKILLVSTPRDSYVMIHGTTGLKDKLTHAGSRGGVELSQKTIEDLYGLKVNRYMRVNFNFVMKLVDAIGGITINSDVDFVVKTAYHGCTFSPGINSVDGRCALGFTRERYAYADGDRHRGRNQIHVIEQIFKKLTSGSTVLRNYSQILQSLDGTFDTNISSEDILSLIRMQLDDMSKWQIESFNVDGSGAMRRTNSYPNQDLYVMDIDMSTLRTAKEKIQNIINN